MRELEKIIDCYDKTAANYADKFFNELEFKHFDRILLKAFADENKAKGRLIDLGCGPGQTTRFLVENGCKNILGVDLSTEMTKAASLKSPMIAFEQGDMLDLKYADESFASAVAFYAIVNLTLSQVKIAFKEIKRVLQADGHFLFSFHNGQGIVHYDEFLDKKVNIDFYYFEADEVKNLLTEVGFEFVDIIKRQPYLSEYPSERAYIWVKKSD